MVARGGPVTAPRRRVNPCKMALNERFLRLPGAAPQRADRGLPQGGVETLHENALHQLELLGPDGRLAAHGQHALVLGGRVGGGGDRAARGCRPRLLDAGQQGGRRELRRPAAGSAEEIGRGASRLTRRCASCMTAPGEIRRRATEASPAPGTWPRSVVAITLWPPERSSRREQSRGARRRARS